MKQIFSVAIVKLGGFFDMVHLALSKRLAVRCPASEHLARRAGNGFDLQGEGPGAADAGLFQNSGKIGQTCFA
jgi:hypothetical protein